MRFPSRAMLPRLRDALTGTVSLWIAFCVVHAALMWGARQSPAQFGGDVSLYHFWAMGGMNDGTWPVLDFDWVYPVGALFPITAPAVLTQDGEAYQFAYMALVTLFNGLALGSLQHISNARGGGQGDGRGGGSGSGRGRHAGAWWYLLFLTALGPITLTRIDGLSAAVTVIALAQIVPRTTAPRGRVGLATVFATLGAWMKIAPGAAVLSFALTSRKPLRRVVVPAAATSVVVVACALVGGAGARVASFLGQQGDRGLQVESVGATPFSVARAWGGTFEAYYNENLSTWEISGPGTHLVSSLLNPLLVLAVAGACWALWAAADRVGQASHRARAGQFAPLPDDSLPDGERNIRAEGDARVEDDARVERNTRVELALFGTALLSLLMVVFNKVGSPQFEAWFAPPVAVAMAAFGPRRLRCGGRSWSWTALMVSLPIIAAMTYALYPHMYGDFLEGTGIVVIVAAIRNLLVFALVALLFVDLLRPRRAADGHGETHGKHAAAGAAAASAVAGASAVADTGTAAGVVATSPGAAPGAVLGTPPGAVLPGAAPESST